MPISRSRRTRGSITQLTELIEQSASRADAFVVAPRLLGALAGVLADGTLETHLTMACLEDDDALEFASSALYEGQAVLFPDDPPEQA